MTIAIIGGLDRLKGEYTKLADEHEDMDIRVFSQSKPKLGSRLADVDGVVLFTNLVSHNAAKQVYRMARANKIELVCSHSGGISAARSCVTALAQTVNEDS